MRGALDAYGEQREELASEGRVLPGALSSLREFAMREGIRQSVITGSIKEIAAIKAGAFGLSPFLDIANGSYGNPLMQRSLMMDAARRRSVDASGRPTPREKTLVVADTVHDMQGAVDAGVHAVGVATGPNAVDELIYSGAEIALTSLEDISELRKLIDAIESGPAPA
ncbi:MAG TPA: haloacid dehalogenase-like hydrolase [Actinocrinis sp.]